MLDFVNYFFHICLSISLIFSIVCIILLVSYLRKKQRTQTLRVQFSSSPLSAKPLQVYTSNPLFFSLDSGLGEYVHKMFLTVNVPLDASLIDATDDILNEKKCRAFLGFFEDPLPEDGDPVSRLDYDRPYGRDPQGNKYNLQNLPVCTNGIILADTNGPARLNVDDDSIAIQNRDESVFFDLTTAQPRTEINHLRFLSSYRKQFLQDTKYYFFLEIYNPFQKSGSFEFDATLDIEIKSGVTTNS